MSVLALCLRRLVQLAAQPQQPGRAAMMWQLASALDSQTSVHHAAMPNPANCIANTAAVRGMASQTSKATAAAAAAQPALHSFTKAYVEHVLAELQIAPGGLAKLLASADTTDEDVISWALARVEQHPAQHLAAPLAVQLRTLSDIVGAQQAWQHAQVPHAMLLQHIAVSAETERLKALTPEQLRALPEYPFAAAAAGVGRGQAAGQEERVRAFLMLPAQQWQLQVSPLEALRLPDFWQRAARAIEAGADMELMSAELQKLGYTQAAQQAQQQMAQMVGLLQGGSPAPSVEGLQQELQPAAATAASSSGSDEGVSSASSGVSTNAAAAHLQRLLAEQLGCSPSSSSELVHRLVGRYQAPPALGEALSAAVAAAQPALASALQAMPQQAAASAAWQDVVAAAQQQSGSAEAVQALVEQLQRWRAAAAAAGNVAVAFALSRAEVHELSEQQFRALVAHIQAWGARGRLLVDAYLSGSGPVASALSDADVASLAWTLHKEPALAGQLVEGVLAAARLGQGSALVTMDEARDALIDASVGFAVEKEVARLSESGRPPALLMSGALGSEVPEMKKGVRPVGFPRLAAAVPKQAPPAKVAQDLMEWLGAGGANAQPPGSWREAAEKLAPSKRKLPSSLQGLFGELLGMRVPPGDTDALKQLQSKICAFLSALDHEMGGAAAADSAAAVVADAGQQPGLHWLLGSASAANRATRGLADLLGEQEANQMLLSFEDEPRRERRDRREREPDVQPYELLGEVHHDLHMQRYLNAQFDPDRQLDLVNPPTGWRDPALFESPAEFLEGMRPLLDAHLASQGERGLLDGEWQVYSHAALAEYEQYEAAHASAARRAGASGFHNSRADEAYLSQRLEKGMPQSSPIRAAAAKYLAAACQNPTWSFAQRRHLVDRLIEIAGHLAANPPRARRGSPFSALFAQDGAPLVPRLSRQGARKGASSGAKQRPEPVQLPAGFGAGRRGGQRAARHSKQAAAVAG